MGSWLWEKLDHVLDASSQYILPASWEPALSPMAVASQLFGAVTVSSKGPLPFCQVSCVRMVGNMVRQVDSMISYFAG